MQEQAQSESELLHIRREKLEAMRAKGLEPFGGRFDTTHQPGALRNDFAPDLEVRVAGRMTARRTMGKAVFFDLTDITGRIQCYVNKKEIGDEAFALLTDLLDLGDWVGVTGKTFVTKTGEPSVHTATLTVLSKSLRPMPDKFHGVTDREMKYRQRYLDLISNEGSRKVFVTRSLMVAEIRRYLQDRGFLEVETPMMQDVPGGAAAKPFETFFHALDQAMYLRIAPELYLKRLLVGGMTKIFELNRNFRNEGLSRRHNPEFTMLEAYWAFSDFEQMADLVEGMVCHLAEKFFGGLLIEHKDDEGNVTRTINLQRPWRRARYHDLIRGVAGDGWFELTTAEKRSHCTALGVEISEAMEDYEITQHVFEKLVEEKSFDPLFVTHSPKELVPLARQNKADGTLVDVYELVINGVEISPGYTELNDPDVQRERLAHQAGEETQKVDEDFLLALEYGMPSAGGIGVGIDRLVMMLTGAESIRDVVLFPQLKRK
jgi:lysyl-tRNA synthetase class 2